MSSLPGPVMAGKRARSAATISAVSSTESVVWVTKERGLGDEGEALGVAGFEAGDVLDGFHEQHLAGRQLAHGADGLGMAGVADHDHLQAVRMVARRLGMDLGHQRAGGVDIEHAAGLGLGGHRLRHAMGGKDHRPVGRAFVEFLDEDRSPGAQSVDHEAVVHDLVPDVDRRAPFLERHLHDLDRPVDAGAEAARRGEEDRQGFGHGRLFRSGSAAVSRVAAI